MAAKKAKNKKNDKAQKKVIKKKEVKKVKAKVAKKPVAKKAVKPVAKKTAKIAKKPEKTAKKVTLATKNTEKPTKEKIEKKPVEAPKNVEKTLKSPAPKTSFKVGEYAVYPSHGIGKITGVEHMKVLGEDFSCYLMYFEKEKLTIKIPLKNVASMNLRPLVTKAQMEEVFSILRSGIKKLKGMWSRRAQEYESKINSGDIVLLAEVLRDLTRDIEDGERSYSERIIYETAVARLAAEYATIYNIDFEEAKAKVVATAKDKLGIDPDEKPARRDDDDFDYDKKSDDEEDEDEDDEEDEDEDEDEDDDSYEDDEDDDDRPRKKRK